METKSSYFKYCIVPSCKNTTVHVPHKIFLTLPQDKIRRSKWLKACKRSETDISQNSKSLHVCGDHFNLEEDMDNYIKFKLMGGRKKMKPNAVPHIFDWQPDRKGAFSQSPRSVATRTKRRIDDDVVASTSTLSAEDLGNTQIDQSSIQSVQSPNYCEVPLTPAIEKKDMKTQARPKVRSKYIQCNLRF